MSPEAPLYERDPAAWNAYLAEGNAKQPRKRVGADVLIRDSQGAILLVNPRYKPDWDLPGGMAEANEPSAAAARREIKEELGLDIAIGRMLVVDWVPPHGPWDDSLMFISTAGSSPTPSTPSTTKSKQSASSPPMRPNNYCAPTSGTACATPSKPPDTWNTATPDIPSPDPPRTPRSPIACG